LSSFFCFDKKITFVKKAISSIYIHIPYCKKACTYCNFHFSTTLKNKTHLINAICKELRNRKSEFKNETVKSIYFGGGTPSICSSAEIESIIQTIYENYTVLKNAEITLEANPDDLSAEKIMELKKTPINRLSIGIQSFFEKDLQLMNRSHTAKEALNCIIEAQKHFKNISIDLIYGIPNLTNEQWLKNLHQVISLNIPHISAYALTVEPNTVLEKQIQKKVITAPKDSIANEHYEILVTTLQNENYINYEFSNFGKDGFFSQNNTGYWKGEKYIGIGPSAHSFNGFQRSWNIANNNQYLMGIENNKPNFEIETLTLEDQFNEYVMTGLRTMWGISLQKIEEKFGQKYLDHLKKYSQKHINNNLLQLENNHFFITQNGKFLTDGIASDLFFLN